jgi:hypothetical protein
LYNPTHGGELDTRGLREFLEYLSSPLPYVPTLFLQGCKFTDTIPWSIGVLKILKELDISEKNFNIELPTSVGALGNLTKLFAKVLGSVGAYQKSLVTARSLRS